MKSEVHDPRLRGPKLNADWSIRPLPNSKLFFRESERVEFFRLDHHLVKFNLISTWKIMFEVINNHHIVVTTIMQK